MSLAKSSSVLDNLFNRRLLKNFWHVCPLFKIHPRINKNLDLEPVYLNVFES